MTGNRKTIQEIERALRSKNVKKLREIAFWPGGFQNNDVRRKVWPVLLGIRSDQQEKNFQTYLQGIPENDFRNPKSYINNPEKKKDVIRREKTVSCIVGDIIRMGYEKDNINKVLLESQSLAKMVTAILMKHKNLHYYQGLTDVVAVFMLVMIPNNDTTQENVQRCFNVVEKATLFYLTDFMLEKDTTLHYLIFPLLHILNPKLALHIQWAEKLNPGFNVSYGLIHWYSHDSYNTDYSVYARRFDAFLSMKSPLFPLYFCAVYLNSLSDEILKYTDLQELVLFLNDGIISKKSQKLTEDVLLQEALQLFTQFPPDLLQGMGIWRFLGLGLLALLFL
jgi:hypothetical protein